MMKQHAVNRAAFLAASSLSTIFAIAASGRAFADDPTPATPEDLTDDVVNAHRERQEEILAQSRAILGKCDADKCDPTDEEGKELDDLQDEFDSLEVHIDRRLAVLRRERRANDRNATPRGRRTDPTAAPDPLDDDDARPRARVLGSPARAHGTFGFRHPGEFYSAVAQAALSRNSQVDSRLLAAAATSISTEGSGPDGGFAVPPDYRATIMERVLSQDELLVRCDLQDSSSNTMTFPTDMTTDWQETGGIQAYWEGETDAIAQSKVLLQNVTLRLYKLAALVPVSEELLEDAPAMGSYVQRKAPQKMSFKISYAIAWGNGAGMPLGYMHSAALVTVPAESGPQAADTIVAGNCVKMLSRLPIASRRSAVWLIHSDAEPQLPLMQIGNQPVYLPPGGLRDNPYGVLLGRPVIPHQVCEAVGDLGDIQLVDLQQYLAIKKAGGIKATTSIHIWFDQDLTAFKFTFRLAGQPWWSAPAMPRVGSSEQSPFVTLAAR